MARVYVTLDLETTGLNPKRDQIIEVGAVRFKGSRILEEFQSLINPGRHIPYQIEHLTGISNDMVVNAPPFERIAPALRRFVGDSPIIGHNISFDLSFLKNHNLFERNIGIDTFEIASILLPHADRYSLQALARLLEIEEPPTHRALDDAKVTHLLFEALLDQARLLDSQIIKDVADMAGKSKWTLAPIFKDLARERSGFFSNPLGQQLITKDFNIIEDAPPLKPVHPPQPLDIEYLAGLLEEGGLFDKTFSHFEHRPQQVDMLRYVAEAFNQPYHLMVEAGTGTGKSIAYLIPAIHWALQNNMRVVISTNTIALQDQILSKDLPDLKKLLGLEFNAVSLKGRGNYVCPWRVNQMRRKASLNPAELRLLAKILIWLPNTVTGDRQELFMPTYAEQAMWGQVNANAEICPPDRCAREGCFFAQARQKAETAHLIVVNHALLLADIAVNNRAIPDYQYLIIDEAHHLEESITNQLGFAANKKHVEQLLSDLSNAKTSPFAEISRHIKNAGLNNLLSEAENLAVVANRQAEQANKSWYTLFNTLETVINEFSGGTRNQYDRKLRISTEMRLQPAWSDVEIIWDNANAALGDVIKSLLKAGKLWDSLDTYDVDNWESMMQRLTGYRQQLDEVKSYLNIILAQGDDNTITWLEQKVNTEDISLHAAPLHVGDKVRRHLLEAKSSVVLTSATIRTDNSFEYIKERLGAWDVAEIAVGSPFEYASSTMVYVPTNIPEPGAPNYQNIFSQTLIDLAIATQGRMLVLFTSYSHLRTTAGNVTRTLAEHDIVVYQQGAGASRRQLLQNFKSATKAVLMGTRSFWEGIDIPGPDLSCLVIAKIPFAVPSDPIFQARSETFEDSFLQYSIPEAILHFRQGFGCLIRTQTDRGVVVVMDRRVLSKGYGRAFLESLPDVTLQQGLTTDLPTIAAEWIKGDIA